MNRSNVTRVLGSAISAVVGSKIANERAKAGIGGAIIGLGAAAIARRSIPGAILVGGVMLAKELYDRKKASEEAEVKVKAAKKAIRKEPATPPTKALEKTLIKSAPKSKPT